MRVGVAGNGRQVQARALVGVGKRGLIGIDDRGDGAGEHRQAADGLPALDGNAGDAGAADLHDLKAARTGTEHANDVMEHVARHHARTQRAVEVDARGLRHLHRHVIADESFQDVAAQTDGQRAEGAKLADVPIKMHDECAGTGIAEFGGDLMSDAAPLIQRDILFPAPVARLDVEFFFLSCRDRDHVVDENGEAIRLGNPLDAEILFHLLENDIGVAGKVIHHDEVRLGHHLVAGTHEGLAGDARQDFFCQRIAHILSRPAVRPQAFFVPSSIENEHQV